MISFDEAKFPLNFDQVQRSGGHIKVSPLQFLVGGS